MAPGPWEEPNELPPEPRQGREPLFNLRPWDAPGALLGGLMVAVFVAGTFLGGPLGWATSAQVLSHGRYETLVTHIFVHAGLMHLVVNLGALLGLSRVVMHRLGAGAGAWARYLTLFLLSGLSGAGLFLAINPDGAIPMLGASGAICGLWGAAARLSPDGLTITPLRSRQVLVTIREFAVINLVLFLLLFGLTRMAGGAGGLAWEAHLGGFLFGLLAMPVLARRP